MPLRLIVGRKLRNDFHAAAERHAASRASPADIPRLQMELIAKAWAEAITDIPYYEDLVVKGISPRSIRNWEDFRRIPVLTRQALQSSPDDFIRRSRQPDSFMKTAGSTGTPLRLGLDQSERDWMRIIKLSEWIRFDYNPSSRLFLIWGHSHLLGTGWLGRWNHLKRKAADHFLGYKRVDAYRLDPKLCSEHAAKLIQFRPHGLIGYASALDLFARNTLINREQFRELGVRFILATSEPLPRPDTLALLEDLFNCPVVQEYGGAEFGQVAFHAGKGQFNVYSDLNYLECEPAEADELGAFPVLVTSLYDRYLPLFRYRIGDAVRSPVKLSNGHVSEFVSVAGRINDTIAMSDGCCIHSVAIFHCIHQESSVHNIQMHLNDERIEIRLLITTPHTGEVEHRIRQRLHQIHPELRTAKIVFVNDLEANRAGKRRWFIDERTKP
jgi:phenylacetate-CoA ligase